MNTKYGVRSWDKHPTIVIVCCNHWPNFYDHALSEDRYVLWEMIPNNIYRNLNFPEGKNSRVAYDFQLVKCVRPRNNE